MREPDELAAAIEKSIVDHQAVVRLDGGPFGVISTHGPGRRVLGVAVTGAGRAVELGVVLEFGHRIPDVLAELRERVREIAGPVRVDITVSDLITPKSTVDT